MASSPSARWPATLIFDADAGITALGFEHQVRPVLTGPFDQVADGFTLGPGGPAGEKPSGPGRVGARFPDESAWIASR
jgi:hypothetical protein